jgi:tripartite-type tricarboxylate transporter receptor subunit TctC
VRKLNLEIDAVLREPRVRDKLATLGFEPVGGAPAELARRVRENVPKWAAVIKQAGVVPD